MSNPCVLCTRDAFEVKGNCPTTCLRALQSWKNKIHVVRIEAGDVVPVWVGYLCLGYSLCREWTIRDEAGGLRATCNTVVTWGLWTKYDSGWIPETEAPGTIHGPYWSWLLPVRLEGYTLKPSLCSFEKDAHVLTVHPYNVDPNDIRI